MLCNKRKTFFHWGATCTHEATFLLNIVYTLIYLEKLLYEVFMTVLLQPHTIQGIEAKKH